MWETQLRKMLTGQAETIQRETTVADEVMSRVQSGSKRRVKSRKPFIVAIISCSILIFTGGVYADQLYNYWKVPSTAEEVRKTEELSKELAEQRQTVDDAIANTFGLDLANYSSLEVNDLFKSEKVHPLLPIVSEIMDNQQINDRKPSVYINNQTQQDGYIFEDKVNACVVHVMKKDAAGEWQIVSVQEKQKNG
ncbi:hypothetical protein [uncultured Brevibacillus sp.]|uniref:hypothetical protein n=1 Tax=uncultured Brevibacillus sp. TaxID=169970 RepID=UPI0025940AC4|nr:hypothetical protein [uncultured Brevibacillus sp.]